MGWGMSPNTNGSGKAFKAEYDDIVDNHNKK